MQGLKDRLLRSFDSLPPRQQRELITIAELLCQKKLKEYTTEKIKTDFFGSWADRSEIQNSSEWVRNLRKNEWNIC